MKILMIGGTGFFGRLLATKLLKAGHQLTLLTRGNEKPSAVWAKTAHIVCDRTEHTKFKQKLANQSFDVVIDNVVNDQQDIESIITVFASRPKPPQYIFCSSVAVYPDWMHAKSELVEKDATLELQHGDDWKITYANGKRAAERYLLAHHGAMPYTIMRPTVIEGPGDPHKRTLFWIQRIQAGNPILVSAKNTNVLYRHVSSTDVAQAFFLAVGNKQAYNQIYNVAGKEKLTIGEYVKYIAAALEKPKVRLCWVSEKKLKAKLPDYELPAFFEQTRLISSIKKIENDLGYVPRETSDWIEETVNVFVQKQKLMSRTKEIENERRVSALFKKNHEILDVVKDDAYVFQAM
jgi:nucleoside-diphosphate-sugar epimerase